jgi:hypothetical protein
MPTSLVSTGVQFPDLTTQTTAAVAGGGYALNAYASPATWSKPVGLKAIKVTVVGAGGNGGSASAPGPAANRNAGGGGAGGAAIEFIPAPSIPGPVAVTAGPGTNSFGAFCSATGGSNGTPATSPGGTAGGAGGAGSGGDINFSGARGAVGLSGSPPGYGGNSILSGVASSQNAPNPGSLAGTAGLNYGGGGAGANINNAINPSVAGGTGAPGIVIVEEFY